MAECNKINYYTIIFGAAGLAIGFFLNMYANNLSNKKLLADLKAELQGYQTARGKATPEMELRKIQLDAQIKILESK